MSTVEDVFCLYERNSNYYFNCKLNGNDCPNFCSYLEMCCCNKYQSVLPFVIGDPFAECNMKYKCYIRPGEECPICYEKILTKSSAFLTNCGHAYHKKCLMKYMELNWKTNGYAWIIKCPMCRCCLGHPEFIKRYKYSYYSIRYKDDNELDKLEDFWISCEYKLPVYCINKFDHYLGMNKDCHECINYREKG